MATKTLNRPALKRPKRSYSDAEKAAALITLDANGGNALATANALNLPMMTLHQWKTGEHGINDDVTKMRNAKSEYFAGRIDDAIDRALDAVTDDKLTDAPVNHLSTFIGTMIDKARILRDLPSADAKLHAQTQMTHDQKQAALEAIRVRCEWYAKQTPAATVLILPSQSESEAASVGATQQTPPTDGETPTPQSDPLPIVGAS